MLRLLSRVELVRRVLASKSVKDVAVCHGVFHPEYLRKETLGGLDADVPNAQGLQIRRWPEDEVLV
jgi:hypothetical protein